MCANFLWLTGRTIELTAATGGTPCTSVDINCMKMRFSRHIERDGKGNDG